jgi:hypothetical protein
VLELLFSAGLVAVLRGVEPRKIITCGEPDSRLSANRRSEEASQLGILFATLDSEVLILDSMVPPPETEAPPDHLSSWQSPFWHFEFSAYPTYLYIPINPPSLAIITSQRPEHPPPLHLLLFTTTVQVGSLPTKAEQTRRSYGPETVRARRSTTTRYLGARSSTLS